MVRNCKKKKKPTESFLFLTVASLTTTTSVTIQYFLTFQMKGVFLVLALLVVMSMDVLAGYKECAIDCETKTVTCLNNPQRCYEPTMCQSACLNPFYLCKDGCKRKRELLSRFAFQDDDAENFTR